MESKVFDPTGLSKSTSRKRTRSSTLRALESTVAQFDELLATAELKEGKRGDVLIAKANALRELLALEADARDREAQDTITRLEDQHASDSRRISDLNAENNRLRSKPEEVRTVHDPEDEIIRDERDAMAVVIRFIAGVLPESERQRMAILACQRLRQDAARLVCQSFDFNFNEQMQMLRTYETDGALREVISKAQIAGPAVRFAQAMLALRNPAAATILTSPSEESLFN